MARRGAQQQPNALVAAATNIELSDRKMAAKQAGRRQAWQTEAWAYFYEVPELGEAVLYRGNQLAKLRLFVATQNPKDPKGDPIPALDPDSGVPPAVAVAAEMELARMHGQYGGHGEIIRELTYNWDVAAECYLVGIAAHEVAVKRRGGLVEQVQVPEDWQIRSVTEVDQREGRYVVKDYPGDTKGRELDPERDTIIRLWLRDPQWSALPHCAMRGLLGECRTLQVLSQQVLAQAMRAVSAGFFTVPNELSFGPAAPTDPEGDPEAEGDPLNQALNDVLVRPIDDPSDPSTVQPGVLRGPAEFLKPDVLRRISFYDATLDTVLEAKIEARVQRIARGINLPVEKVMGHQQTTFANAEQVDEDEFNDYLRPSADQAVDSLSWAFLVPQLLENPAVGPEWADGRLFIWYDPSDLIAQPSREKNADRGLELGTISEAAWRGAKGYGDDDAPDVLELLTRAGLRRGILTADLTLALMELLGTDIDVDTPAEVPAADQVAAAESDQAAARAQLLQLLVAGMGTVPDHVAPRRAIEAQAVVAAAGNDYGRQLTDIDRELRTRLTVAANDAMDRALERAANVLRSKANGTELKSVLRDVPKRRVFAQLGPALVRTVLGDADPLAGAWDGLEDQFMAWGAQAQQQAIDVAGQVAAGFTRSERAALQLRQADDLTEAWGWMRDAMGSLAEARMFDPDPSILEVGEFDPTMRVPTGLVRQAIARAGGATGLMTEQGGVWLALTDAGTRPAGGIGTGELMRTALRDEGVNVEAYEWTYGPAFRQRPFEPHLSLDGVRFRNFDDPVLANTEGWPSVAFYLPGDHTGCNCDFIPIVVPASEVS